MNEITSQTKLSNNYDILIQKILVLVSDPSNKDLVLAKTINELINDFVLISEENYDDILNDLEQLEIENPELSRPLFYKYSLPRLLTMGLSYDQIEESYGFPIPDEIKEKNNV